MKLLNRFDFGVFILPILIITFSLSVLYSTAPNLARNQFYFLIPGVFVYLFAFFINLGVLKRFSPVIFIAVIILNLMLYFVGEEVRGTRRWLLVGPYSVQPSEILKVAYILLLSTVLRFADINKINAPFLVSLGVTAVSVIVVFLQPDLGSALLLCAIFSFYFLYKGLGIRKILIFSISLVVVSFPLWGSLREYQKKRITGFLHPEKDISGINYNVYQSILAVGSGGISGRGFGRGTQSHLRFLPEYHTDFIFAAFAEEWGFLASTSLILFYTLLLYKILKISKDASNKFGSLLAFGVFSILFFQVVVNIGMNMGLMPVTGSPLPLMSYGGSSLLSTLFMLGLVQNVYANRKI